MSNPWIYMNGTLGFTIPVKVPFTTTEEYDALAGEPGAWKNGLAALACYASFNKAFADAFAERLAEITGVAIPTTGEKRKVRGGGEVDVYISTKQFLALLYEQKAITEVKAQEIATEVANALPPLEIGGSRGPAKPSKEFYTKAQQIRSQCSQTGTDLADYVARVQGAFPGGPELGDDGITDDFLAALLKHATSAQLLNL